MNIKTSTIFSLIITVLLLGNLTIIISVYGSNAAINIRSNHPAILKEQFYGGKNTDYAKSIIRTKDGGFALLGYTDSFGVGGSDVLLAKLDVNGTMKWNRTYASLNRDIPRDFIQTTDGGFAFVGSTYYSSSRDGWLIKTHANGTLAWEKRFDNSCQSIAHCDDDCLMIGRTVSESNDTNILLTKLTYDGNIEWNKTYGSATWREELYTMISTADGGFIMSGPTAYKAEGIDNDRYDIWILKINENGAQEWNKTISFSGPETNCFGWCVEYILSITQTQDGGFAFAGTVFFPYESFLFFKTDATGNMQWNTTFNTDNGDQAMSIVQTNSGGFILTGKSYYYPAEGDDIENSLMVKYSDTGKYQGNIQFTEAQFQRFSSSCVIDNDIIAVVGGKTPELNDNIDMWFIIIDTNKIKADSAWIHGFDLIIVLISLIACTYASNARYN